MKKIYVWIKGSKLKYSWLQDPNQTSVENQNNARH